MPPPEGVPPQRESPFILLLLGQENTRVIPEGPLLKGGGSFSKDPRAGSGGFA